MREFFMQNFFKRYREELFVVFVAILGTMLAFQDIDSWKFSLLGDESEWWFFAKDIASKKLLVNPFSFNGVYNEQTVFASYLQAVFLFLFGINYFSWKLSGIVMIFPSVILLFQFARRLYGRNPALICAVLLAFSKYLCNFFKIGYPDPLGFLAFIICLFYAGELLRVPSIVNAFKWGVALGLASFFYLGHLFPFFLLPFIIALFRRIKIIEVLKLGTIVFIVFLVFFGIGLLNTDLGVWWEAMNRKSFHREFDSSIQIVINIGRNFLLFFNNFDYFYNHFVEGPYLDVVSRWAAVFGILMCVWKFRKKEGLLLFSWVMVCIGIGFSSPYTYTPSTRGIFFITYGVMFAALGLEFLRKELNRIRWGHIIPFLVIVAVALNIYEAKVSVFKKTGFSSTALIMKELLEENQNVIVYHSPRNAFDKQALNTSMELHYIPSSRLFFISNIDEVCDAKADKILLLEDDPIFKETNFNELCSEFDRPFRVTAIQGYYPITERNRKWKGR